GRVDAVLAHPVKPGDDLRREAHPRAAQHADAVQRHPFGHAVRRAPDDPRHVRAVPVAVFTGEAERIVHVVRPSLEVRRERPDPGIDDVHVHARPVSRLVARSRTLAGLRPWVDGTGAADWGCVVVTSRQAAAAKGANAASTATVGFEHIAAVLEGVHDEGLAVSVPSVAPTVALTAKQRGG